MAGLLLMSAQAAWAQTTDVSDMSDVTELIANPGFDNDYDGWTIEVPGKKISTAEKADGLIAGTQKHLQLWVGSGGMKGRVSQELKELPAGLYVFQVAVSPSFNGTVKLFAGENTTDIVSGAPKVYDVAFNFAGGDLTLGLDIDATGSVTIDMDNFQLFYKSAGEEDGELTLALQQFDKVMANAIAFADGKMADYVGLYDEFYEIYDELDQTDRDDKAALTAATDSLKALVPTFETALSLLADYQILLGKSSRVLESDVHYPGYDTFYEMVSAETEFDVNGAKRAEIASHYSALKEGLTTYYFSQEASETSPADYTFLVQNPSFCVESALPAVGADGSVTYPHAAEYKVGSAPSDATSQGWTRGASGGDQRLNWHQGRICWNAWGSNFKTLSISQEIKNLPDGLYTVSAEMITQEGCVADQHVYAKSNLAEVVSPGLSFVGWNADAPESAVWETLTTEKILVDNHTLTIGAMGSHPADAANGSAGWFLVTNFKLNYLGAAADNVIAEMYNQSLTNAKDQTTKLLLKGDAAQLQAIIDQYAGAVTGADMKAAIQYLDSATLAAQSLQTQTQTLLDGNYKTLKEELGAGNTYKDRALVLAQSALAHFEEYLTSDAATYTVLEGQDKSLAAFRTSYLQTVQTATGEKLSLDAAKDALNECLDIQQTQLWNEGLLTAVADINKMVANLKLAVRKCLAAQYMADGTTDYTKLIENPTIAGNVVGWTVSRPTGNQDMSSGKDYDGVKSGYLNSWNGKAGALRYTAYQTIHNIPNGRFRVKAMYRVMDVKPGSEGVYMYAIADADTASAIFKAVHQETVNYTKYVSGDTKAADGSDSIQYVKDKYGSVWQDAMDRTNMGENVVPGSLDEAILEAGAGWGCGWQWKELEVTVRNHQLTIGATCDSVLTNGRVDTDGNPCVPFTGTQFSADEFSLEQIEAGDNEGWTPLTDMANAVEQIPAGGADNNVKTRVYTLDGIEIPESEMQYKGVYILKDAKGSRKVVVLKR